MATDRLAHGAILVMDGARFVEQVSPGGVRAQHAVDGPGQVHRRRTCRTELRTTAGKVAAGPFREDHAVGGGNADCRGTSDPHVADRAHNAGDIGLVFEHDATRQDALVEKLELAVLPLDGWGDTHALGAHQRAAMASW